MLHRRPNLCVALLSVWVMLAALLPAKAEDSAATSLTIGVRQFPADLHPLFDPTIAKSYVLGMVLRPITAYDRDWHLICLLCAELPTVDTTSSSPVVQLTLRNDLRWGDGSPLTTRDLVFTWQLARDPRSGVAHAEVFRRISDIDVIDEHSARLHVDTPSFDTANLNDVTILPEKAEQSAAAHGTKAYRHRSLYTATPTNPALYDGPYVVAEVVNGSHVTLKRNPYWQGQAPGFDRIIVRAIESVTALQADLLSGDIDMIAGEAGIAVDQATRLESQFPDRFNILYQLGVDFEHIDFNLDNPTLADLRVRKALLYAIDRDDIVRTIFAGKYRVADLPISPLDPNFFKDVPHHGYDPQLAVSLLQQAGWRMTKQNVRVNENGAPLRLEIISPAGASSRDEVLRVLQNRWHNVGVDVRIRTVPTRTFFGVELGKRKFPAMALYAYSSAPGRVPRGVLQSTQVPSAANHWAGVNYTGFRDPQMDAALDRMEIETDPAAWKSVSASVQKIFGSELPALPLYFDSLAYVLPKWLQGVEPTGHNSITTLGVERWSDLRRR